MFAVVQEAMMARIEVLTGPGRRRRWSAEQKRELVAAAFAPDAVVSDVARQADLCTSQLYRWRWELRARENLGFAEVIVSSGSSTASGSAEPVIEVRLACGSHIRIGGTARSDLAAAVVKALACR